MASEHKQHAGISVHETLAHGYLTYIGAMLIGFIADHFYPLRFSFVGSQYVGLFLILAGTALIFWAQQSSGKSAAARSDTSKVCRTNFTNGPYAFSRSPTQYGLAIMMLGLAFLYGMFFLVIAAVVALVIGRFVFIKKEEMHLAEKYGAPYLEYQKHVRF